MRTLDQQAPTTISTTKGRRSEQFMRPQEIAKNFGVDPKTVMKWLKSGILPYSKIGPKVYLIPRTAVERLKTVQKEPHAA